MPCFYPIQAYRIGDKKNRNFGIVFSAVKGMNVIGELKVPCGQCIGCKLERARQWSVRCMHEASLYEKNCFITLTYNNEHLPDGNSLDYSDFQKFFKRLRKKFCYYLPTSKHQGPFRRLRFFMCGEYGEDYGRAHFHACLFNFDFDDRIYFKTTPSGSKIYTSKTLDDLWTDKNGNSLGFASVGDVNINSAGYVARYVTEKKFGMEAEKKLEAIDLETGEVYLRKPEFNKMSLKPGIGQGFYEKYKRDIFPHDICVVEGKETKPPKYYYNKLKKEDGFSYDEINFIREKRARESMADNTPERLLQKETVLKARLKFLKREIS